MTVRDHMMVAHSLRGEVFGPAQRLHGATFVVDATFRARELDADGSSSTSAWPPRRCTRSSATLTYRNLDEDPAFAGMDTTTEVLARRGRPARGAIAAGASGPARGTYRLAVTLHDRHVAWASYDVSL